MTDKIAISVKNVSKKYKLFNSPKERLLEALHPFNKKYHREFWALKDVNMDIYQGQTVGIIGRNGSGKSTILQIICSILQPTSGSVTVNGRVSALLELGAGFNPEFTGRDNVYLNGALMGFSREEMKERMPIIETFADIGDFIDQPVKIYSSGMFVRLAFAAAINVDPDILVVDEALAVGDAKFQHKCFNKFKDFQEAGKTIIFVTHDVQSVVKHCDSAILLENGAVLKTGEPGYVTNCYLELMFSGTLSGEKSSNPQTKKLPNEKNTVIKNESLQLELQGFLKEMSETDRCIYRKSYNGNEYRFGDRRAEINDYLIECDSQLDPVTIFSGKTINIYVKIKFNDNIESPSCGFAITTKDMVLILGKNTYMSKIPVGSAKKGEIIVFRFSIKMNLQSGDYFINLGCGELKGNELMPLDRRNGIIHLSLLTNKTLDGIIDLDHEIQEVSRISDEAHVS